MRLLALTLTLVLAGGLALAGDPDAAARARTEKVLAALPELDEGLLGTRPYRVAFQTMFEGEAELRVTKAPAGSGAVYAVELAHGYDAMGLKTSYSARWLLDRRLALVSSKQTTETHRGEEVVLRVVNSAERSGDTWTLKVESTRSWSKTVPAKTPFHEGDVLLFLLAPRLAKAGAGDYAFDVLAYDDEEQGGAVLSVSEPSKEDVDGKAVAGQAVRFGKWTAFVSEGRVVKVWDRGTTFVAGKAAPKKPVPAEAAAVLERCLEVMSGKRPVEDLDDAVDWREFKRGIDPKSKACADLDLATFQAKVRAALGKRAGPRQEQVFRRLLTMPPKVEEDSVTYALGEFRGFVVKKTAAGWRIVEIGGLERLFPSR